MDFLEDELDDILNIFREESEEHTQKINQHLLRLEANPKSNNIITELFREAHSIKGAARMIGLNDIQTLAHKLEDIFAHAREGNLIINAQIIDLLCKATDCISSIVEDSIRTKGVFHSEKVDEMLVQLGSIDEFVISSNQSGNEEQTNSQGESPENEATININTDFYKKNVALIKRISKDLLNLKDYLTDRVIINNIYILYTSLDNIVQGSDLCEKLKDITQEMRTKLESVVKGSGILLGVEVDELLESFDSFMKSFEKGILELDGDKNINQAEGDFEKEIELLISNARSSNQNNTDQNNTDDLESNIKYILDNLSSWTENYEDSTDKMTLISTKLQVIINAPIKENEKKIFSKALEVINFAIDSGIKPGIEIIEVIRESINSAVQMVLGSPHSILEDANLIVQRLGILLQMLKISEPEAEIKKEEKIEQDNLSSPKTDDFPVSQNTQVLPKGENINPHDNEKFVEASSIKPGDSSTIKTLRVDTRKLDQLVNQVGELIIAKIKTKEHLSEIEKITRSLEDWYREWNKAKQMLKHIDKKQIKPNELPSGTSIYSQGKNIYTFFDESSSIISSFVQQMSLLHKDVQEDDARLNLIINELEERIKSVRVLPLATIFHMFPRMVRDIAREKNKEIELIISGSETSVDKKIIEEIKSPLMHIIRNSIDHGIEDPETRIKNNKNPVGTIHLSASHLENSVLIEITDDGKGIDLDLIKKKVLQKGLLTPNELDAMSEAQIMNIIFWPGFSTGNVVTDISGRGVGLDIVYTKINQLDGKVYVKSTPGLGCKISVQLPVTMATIKSFLVRVNNQNFAIPTSTIKTALLIKPEEIFYKEGKKTIIVDNKTVPLFKLSKILEMPEETNKKDKIVVIVIQSEDIQAGFIIDKLIGDQEILHKNLSPPLLRVRNVAGVTTLGSGELCLILNINDLLSTSALLNTSMNKMPFLPKPDRVKTSQRKILVVDDSVTTRILERNILKAAGYDVTVAVNGLDALTKIASEKFDLIVSDVEMPEINGFELTEKIRNDDKSKEIPIILVTSLASEIDRKKGLNLGANAYISKGGFDQEELLSTIKNLI